MSLVKFEVITKGGRIIRKGRCTEDQYTAWKDMYDGTILSIHRVKECGQ